MAQKGCSCGLFHMFEQPNVMSLHPILTDNFIFTSCVLQLRHFKYLKKKNSLVNQSTPPPVFEVRDVPCGGPGAVEPVAAGPDVAGEEAEDIAPATETD